MIPKFRVWDKVTRAMAVVEAIDYVDNKIYTFYRKVVRRYIPFEEAVLMQSTGLKDKNGVEVFDGDIMFYEQDCYQYTLVKYDKDKLAFVLYDGCERLYHALWEPGEVIGNIYENPDLLESVEE
ncbi:TPA: hypothetical protein VC544_000667 [Streptococcus pyogenes]|nr:hypothetical protein [Streptococcus pyogenes]